MNSKTRWLLALIAAGSLTASASSVGAQQGADTSGAPQRPISWLSVGDSYGAGEGATEATGHCQRSPNAAGPKAATILREQRGWTVTPEGFAACTGYLAADVFNTRSYLMSTGFSSFGATPGPAPADSELPNEMSLYDWALNQTSPDQKFDVITISLGGNDIAFADVVTDCIDSPTRGDTWRGWVSGPTGCNPGLFEDDSSTGVGGLGLAGRVRSLTGSANEPDGFAAPAKRLDGSDLQEIGQVYSDLADNLLADGGVVVVMGYPRLITPSDDWGQWRGGRCNMVSAADADRLSAQAERFDEALGQAVVSLGSRFEYVSRLEVFDDGGSYKSLCGRGVEWINTPLLFLRDGTLRLERGFHPNDIGYLETAERVAGVVEARFRVAPEAAGSNQVAEEPGSPPATDAVVRSDEARFDVGSPFSASCQTAWPFAPSRGSASVSMTMSCTGVPSQFLLVNVSYPDPDFPLSSSTRYNVEGTVADISRSEYGYTILVVEADFMAPV